MNTWQKQSWGANEKFEGGACKSLRGHFCMTTRGYQTARVFRSDLLGDLICLGFFASLTCNTCSLHTMGTDCVTLSVRFCTETYGMFDFQQLHKYNILLVNNSFVQQNFFFSYTAIFSLQKLISTKFVSKFLQQNKIKDSSISGYNILSYFFLKKFKINNL